MRKVKKLEHVASRDMLRKEKTMVRGLLLWMIGIPIPIIILLLLFLD